MASTYLSRTTSSAGNQLKHTISFWFKRSNIYSNQTIMSASGDNSHANKRLYVFFSSGDFLYVKQYNGSGTDYELITNKVFRDTNAWYHCVIQYDAANSTANNRQRIWINGVEETSFSARTNPSTSTNSYLGGNGLNVYVGQDTNVSSRFFDGSISHLHYCDGYTYAASDFGETDSTTGIWKPKTTPSVTYGNNGFFLKFENSAAMGTDSAGSNNFTVNGSMTQLIDTPSNVFATLNPLGYAVSNNWTLANGNTSKTTTPTSNAWRSGYGTIGASSGKYYWEFKVDQIESSDPNNIMVGIIDAEKMKHESNNDYFTKQLYAYGYHAQAGSKMTGNGSTSTSTSYGAIYTANDIVGIAMDLDNSKIYFSKNGVWQNSGDPTSGSTGTGSAFTIQSGITYLPAFAQYYGNEHFSINMGNGYFGTTAVSSAENPDDGIGIFEYDVPAGYRALCTKSINAEEYS